MDKLTYSSYFTWSRPPMNKEEFEYYKQNGSLPPMTETQLKEVLEDSPLDLKYTFKQFNQGSISEETLIQLLETFSTKQQVEEFYDDLLSPYWSPSYVPDEDQDKVLDFLDSYVE